MTPPIEFGFETTTKLIPIHQLLESKMSPPRVKSTKKYRQIASSIDIVGLVEPVVVFPVEGARDRYMILDGHLRISVLKDFGETSVLCLIAKDDETFTYNKRINRISTVQEHYMILRAAENGVSEARIAEALGINLHSVRRKKRLLDGICAEVIEILKHTKLPVETATVLQRLTTVRQIEVAELMIAANNTTAPYAKALYMATNPSQLKEKRKKRVSGLSEEERERMERELAAIQRDVRAVEENYGVNMLRLVVANGYIGRLLSNDAVASYLDRHHSGLHEQLLILQESIENDVGLQAK